MKFNLSMEEIFILSFFVYLGYMVGRGSILMGLLMFGIGVYGILSTRN